VSKVKFGIVANPQSGPSSAAHKAQTLKKIAEILGSDTVVAGLDTTSREEFIRCASDLAEKVKVLVVAGGDGTMSDVINALPDRALLSYLPMGSGCALQHALQLPPQMTRIARRIAEGQVRMFDLILCDGRRKAFMASVGFEGHVLNRREALQKNGIRGPQAYALAAFGSLFADLERTDMTIVVDGQTFLVSGVVTTIVTKIPYYGYKMKVVPNAVFDDGQLHLLAVNTPWPQIVQNVADSFFDGNRGGVYQSGLDISVTAQSERYAQTDGTLYRRGRTFHFQVLTQALKMWC
jgi:diacylglycerol kinase (ATP)